MRCKRSALCPRSDFLASPRSCMNRLGGCSAGPQHTAFDAGSCRAALNPKPSTPCLIQTDCLGQPNTVPRNSHCASSSCLHARQPPRARAPAALPRVQRTPPSLLAQRSLKEGVLGIADRPARRVDPLEQLLLVEPRGTPRADLLDRVGPLRLDHEIEAPEAVGVARGQLRPGFLHFSLSRVCDAFQTSQRALFFYHFIATKRIFA